MKNKTKNIGTLTNVIYHEYTVNFHANSFYVKGLILQNRITLSSQTDSYRVAKLHKNLLLFDEYIYNYNYILILKCKTVKFG